MENEGESTTEAGVRSSQAPDQDPPSQPDWIATVSAGVIDRDGDATRPFFVGGLSRRLGRGYVRVAATEFRSALRQIDAVLPSRYTIVSAGVGGTFGSWFVDAYGSIGRQKYGGVTTNLGTRESQVGDSSGIYGAAVSGGRFVALSRRLYLTPSAAIQYSASRALRSTISMQGPLDYETDERAWTGSATLRLDRYLGGSNQHLAGLSISRVQTSNGATALSAGGGPGVSATTVSVADGWFILGSSAAIRVAPRLWLDGALNRTFGAQSGNYVVGSLGLRIGF
ncbi:hypothetical protein [Sphingomonas carotinifaciens]|uniref:hypothetical protein n=1 Tax=Sphingomonas carotinifaciens TaxID=1166323 RepID=UPI0013591B9A|nr:hypothetical protein [Sphingomonas carotinifaciens]